MYDEKCLELAEHFLPEVASRRLKAELAQEIQNAIEDWMTAEAARLAAALGRPV
jgi:hypothetical protein